MSIVNKSLLRHISLLHHISIKRQAILPFSTGVRRLAELTNNNENVKSSSIGSGSYDSIPIHLSSLGKLVMVLGGLYKRIGDVPDTIPNRAYQKTKDRFRARCVILSIFATGLLSLIAATRGKNASKEGKRYTDDVLHMHLGESRLHDQLEAIHKRRSPSERYSPPIDEINK